MAQTQLSATT
uniref:Uncharacterized protein n=1 Tax=Rhizophora mucronata TaxID=61149 RepID=A0A2P2QEX4_RHIMU